MSQSGNLVQPPIRLSAFEDQFSLGRSKMPDRHAIRQNTPSFRIKHFQGRDRRKQRIVSTTRVECERLKEGSCELADISILLGCHHQRRYIPVLHHRFKTGFDLQQPMPADFPVYHLDRVFIGVIGSLQSQNRVEEQS